MLSDQRTYWIDLDTYLEQRSQKLIVHAAVPERHKVAIPQRRSFLAYNDEPRRKTMSGI